MSPQPTPIGVNSTSSTLTDHACAWLVQCKLKHLAYRHGSDEGCCGAEAEDDGDDDATMMMMYEDGFALDGMTVEGYMNSPMVTTYQILAMPLLLRYRLSPQSF
ncbi:unnamed protein product [Pleuronectes platessa]|uniref:Uncharacterized protein n=1 Tax=Pleuronectes platessa TaxID=8262 RepID=A0A9N7YU73_PLEPL|nr:unnamed protein product [Pleuronectes platessa]